ncbi:ADP-ribosylation factor 6 [Taenia crassiceps]|uniref:ADP-ribosylation factor 6 n=1 Tax=Taenia crassiceps TaxID=6207 RepID=A0ABR4QI75_9CEST
MGSGKLDISMLRSQTQAMGQCCCVLHTYLFGAPVIRVLMLGLDNGGKKTILAGLGDVISFEPVRHFQVDTVDYKELYIRSWDIGGFWQPKALWQHFYKYTEALIFVVDCGDYDRIYEARDAIHEILRSVALRGVRVLIFANKQDLTYAMPLSQIMEILEVGKMHDHVWHLQPACALTGAGIFEGIGWLYDELVPQKRKGKTNPLNNHPTG